jgi:hypothetical protein
MSIGELSEIRLLLSLLASLYEECSFCENLYFPALNAMLMHIP